jgi:hypothetical protein
LLFFFSPYCSPFCTALLFSFLHQVVDFLFGYSSILGIRFFVLLFFSSWCYVFLFVLLLLVCCYSLNNLVLPPCIFSCRNWEWLGIKNQKHVFFNKYFSLCLFPFFNFLISCLLFLFLFYFF